MHYISKELSVKLEDLRGLDFKEFLDKTIKLNLVFYDTIMEFYSKSLVSPECLPFMDTYPEYCELTGNYRYRFLIIDLDDDFVFVNLKVVDPMGNNRYFHIYRPISYNGVKDNEVKVMKFLSEIDYVKDIVLIYTSCDSNDYWNNNYYNTRESCDYMFTNKFEKSSGIKKVKNLVDIKVYNYCDDSKRFEVLNLLTLWENNRGKLGRSDRKVLVKLLDLINKRDNIYLVMGYYKDKLIFYRSCYVLLGKYAISRTTKAIGVLGDDVIKQYLGLYNEEDEGIIKALRRVGMYSQQFISNYFLRDGSCEALFNEGDDHVPGLREFKSSYAKNCLYYKKKPLKEHLLDIYYQEEV